MKEILSLLLLVLALSALILISCSSLDNLEVDYY